MINYVYKPIIKKNMKNEIKKFLDYMRGQRSEKTVKSTFVDMLCKGDFKGLETFGTMEGNGLIGAVTGEQFELQCATISRGTEREVQLRSYDYTQQRDNVDERITLSELFPGLEVIIITGGDAIRGIAPVFSNKLDLAIWLKELDEYRHSLPEDDFYGFHTSDMVELAKFLYRNNPNKQKSILDELTDC